MKDTLKDFAEQHRHEFEVYQLDVAKSWSVIQYGLDQAAIKVKRGYWRYVLRGAAVLIVLISISFGFHLNKQLIKIERYGVALQDISNELADTEVYYSEEIGEKLEMIRSAGGIFDPGLLAQLAVLDEDYRLLKKDLNENADNGEVINAMIGHYRLKLQMLEKILMEMQKDHNDEQKV